MEKSPYSVEVSLPCSYLLDKKEDAPFLAVALHGYGQTAEMLAAYSRRLLGPAPSIAAIQGPHPQYLEALPSARIGYHWGTSADWPGAIRLHHEILLKVLAEMPAQPVLLIGFSQPVGLNYRFLATHPGRVRATLALCGGVPKEWTPPEIISTPILHIARSEDEFFPLDTAASFEQRLREVATDVEFQLIPGKHRFPSDGRRLIQSWIRRIFQHDMEDTVLDPIPK